MCPFFFPSYASISADHGVVRLGFLMRGSHAYIYGRGHVNGRVKFDFNLGWRWTDRDEGEGREEYGFFTHLTTTTLP